MDHRKKVPEDLMGTILGDGPGLEDEGFAAAPVPRGAGGAWEEHPERVGIAFNLSKQVGVELEDLRRDLESEETRVSRSEIVEVALQLAIEDARGGGDSSELVQRLRGRHETRAAGTTAGGGPTTQRTVDETGAILETVYGEGGEILDEDVVGNVADLPVETEYLDEAGNLVSVAKDELGNTFEQILDPNLEPLTARLLPSSG